MAEDNIIQFRGVNRLDIQPNKVLKGAVDQLDHVFIAGYDKDGEFYFASSMADGGDVLWLMEKAKNFLMNV